MTTIDSEVRFGATRIAGSGTKPVELATDYEDTSRQRGKTRVSTITKLPGTNRVTPPQVNPLVDNEVSVEEALT